MAMYSYDQQAMACIVIVCIAIAYAIVAYIVTAYVVLIFLVWPTQLWRAVYRYALHRYGMYSYCLHSNGHNDVGHNYVGHNYVGHNYVGHTYVGHEYVGHSRVGHDYACHNYVRHYYAGMAYIHTCGLHLWHVSRVRSKTSACIVEPVAPKSNFHLQQGGTRKTMSRRRAESLHSYGRWSHGCELGETGSLRCGPSPADDFATGHDDHFDARLLTRCC